MGKSSSPPAPDYAGAAEATAAGDLENARYQTLANRPDIFTPEGSRTWEQGTGETFDQTGYDQAMEAYNTDLSAYQNQPPPTYSGGGTARDGDPSYTRYNTGISSGTLTQPTAPNRANFTSTGDPDYWRGTTTLTPEGQKAFDANQRMQTGLAGLGEQAVGQVEGLFSSPFRVEGQAPRYQGAQGEVPGYQGAQGQVPGYTGPGGQIPGYQGPAGQMPGYQGPAGDMPSYGEHRQSVVDAMMSRVDTDIGRDRERTNSNLISQGIPESSEAYGRDMERLDRKQTDARQQAEIAAENMAGMGYSSALAGRGMENTESMNNFLTSMQSRGMTRDEAMDAYNSQIQGRGIERGEGMDTYNTGMQSRNQVNQEGMMDYTTGMQSRNQINQEGMTDYSTGMQSHQQGIQDALLNRQTPLNEISAFRTGSQVNMPQFQAYGNQTYTGGPDYTGAMQSTSAYDIARDNQEIAQKNALYGGMFDLGSAGIGAYGMMAASDRRLKKNIKRLGTSVMGFPVYAFNYIWGGGRQIGVMAQDVIKVKPEAVITMSNGFMAVDYGMIS